MNTGINENTLRQMAYRIWEAEGRPLGQADRHWHMALAQAGEQNDQYLTGKNFLGDTIVSTDITPGDGALVDDREYARMSEAAAESVTFGEGSENDINEENNLQAARKTSKRNKAGNQATLSASRADNSATEKSKNGKKKPSNNILM